MKKYKQFAVEVIANTENVNQCIEKFNRDRRYRIVGCFCYQDKGAATIIFEREEI